MNLPKGKLNFSNPKIKECPGQMDVGTCLDCVRHNPSRGLSCKRLGDFLDKDIWNKIIGGGPLYQNDYRAREITTSPDMRGNEILVDKFGVPLKPRRVA